LANVSCTKILGVSWIAGHPHRSAYRLIQVRQEHRVRSGSLRPSSVSGTGPTPSGLAWMAQTMLPAVRAGEYRAGCIPGSHGYPNIT